MRQNDRMVYFNSVFPMIMVNVRGANTPDKAQKT